MEKELETVEALDITSYRGEVTQDVIDGWKAKYGAVYAVKVEGSICYLKKPDRKTISYASTVGTKDPVKFNEVLLKNCWLGGDMNIQTDDDMFLSAAGVIGGLIEIKNAELEKL